MKKKINKIIAIIVLFFLLIASITLNFLQSKRIDKLSKDVTELYYQQSSIETLINQLHNLEKDGTYE